MIEILLMVLFGICLGMVIGLIHWIYLEALQ